MCLSGEIRQATEALRAAARHLSDSVKDKRAALPNTPWHAELERTKQGYNELIAALKSQGVTDPSEYGKLVQERQRLEGELARLDSLEKQRLQVVAQRAAWEISCSHGASSAKNVRASCSGHLPTIPMCELLWSPMVATRAQSSGLSGRSLESRTIASVMTSSSLEVRGRKGVRSPR